MRLPCEIINVHQNVNPTVSLFMQVNGFETWMAPVALGSCQMSVGVFCVGRCRAIRSLRALREKSFTRLIAVFTAFSLLRDTPYPIMIQMHRLNTLKQDQF